MLLAPFEIFGLILIGVALGMLLSLLFVVVREWF